MLVLFSSAITIATTALQLFTDYRRDLTSIEGSFKLIDTSYLESITNSLWAFDDSQLSSQLEGLLRLPDMEYVAVEVNGETRWSRGARLSEDTITNSFPIIYVQDSRRVELGQLHVAASLDQIIHRLYDKVLVILAGNAVKTFLVSGFLFFVVHTLVTRRVDWLANAIGRLDQESSMPVSDLFSRNGGRRDELDELDTAIREMRESQLDFSQSLREHEAQLDAILNFAPVMISLKDTEGRYLLVNPAWEKTFGCRSDEVLGKLPEEVLPESLVRDATIHDGVSLKGGHPTTVEQITRLEGVDHTFLTTSFSVRNSDGATIGIGTTCRDITERKRAEREILHLNETLEQRVLERTGELAMANSRLRDELAARKQAEEAASTAETKYRDIVENAVEGMVQVTPEGRFISANPAFARMLGYDSPEDLLSSVADVGTKIYADPKRREEVHAMIESCGEINAFESKCHHKDGSVIWLSENSRAVHDQNGKIVRYESFTQDMTVRKQAEIDLRESEERLRLAIESAEFGTWTRAFPDDRVILDARTEAILGLEPGSFEGTLQTYLSRVHPDDRDRIRAGHHNLIEHGKPYECDYRIIWPDGSLHYVASRASLVRNDTDSSRRVIGMLHDITDRKRAETSLRESEERFRAVVDNVPVAIYLKDLDGRYLLHNKFYEEWYGIRPDEIRGRTIDEFFPAEMANAFIAQDKRLLESGAVDSMEIDVVHKDGIVRPTIMIKFPVPDTNGNVAAIGGINIDIAERKRAEDALRAAQNALLRKERLALLGELTGTVAHELRNPLGAVASSAHVLRRKCTGEDADVEKALDIAGRGIKRCDNIITELLDFARAKGLQPVPTNFEDWLSALLAEQQLPAGVTLRHDFDASDAVASFDPEEMRRAVINVVDNACQAMTGGSGDNGSDRKGQLTVKTKATAERIAIDVTDTGPGISRDSLAKVLEPLYSTKPFGTGLGLPTVQRIMEEHGGGLEIDSAEGQGTRVTLWLQRHREASEQPRL